MPIVDIPEVGTVEFPEEMSQADIASAARGIYQERNPRARYESNLAEDAQIRRQERALAGPEEDKQAAGIYEAPARIAKGAVESVGKSVEGVARGVDMVSTAQLNEPQFYAQKLAEVNRQAFPKGVDANTTLLQLADVPKETLAGWQQEYRKQFGSQAERLDRSAVAQMGRRIVAGAPTVDPTRDKEFKSEVLAGIGSTGPVIALSAIPGIGPGVAGAQYGLGAAEDAAQEAQELGGTETQAEVAFLGNMAVGGLSEALIGVGPRLWSIIRKVREAGVKPEAFGRVVLKAAREGALREYAQEGLEQLASNVIASDVAGYDPQRPAMQGVPRAAAVGGTVGGLMGGGAGILSRQQAVNDGQQQTSNVPPPVPPVTPPPVPPVVEEQQVAPGAKVPEQQTSREVVVRGGVPVNRQTGQIASGGQLPASQQVAKPKRGPVASQEEAMGALKNSVLPPGFELKVQPGQKVEAVDVEGTLRERAREFDKLILQYGLEEGWVQNPEIAYDESSSLGGQQGTASIKARILRQKEMASARRRAAIQITGNADIDLSNTRSKADLLPKLKEFVAQKYEVPAKQAQAWERARVKRPGKEQVVTNELVLGDRLKQGTEVLKVSAVDPDTGEVTLDDGIKFGRQVMPEGSVFYVEAVAQAGQEGANEWVEEEPVAPAGQQGPKLRAMEKQGDLMAQQTEEFKLAQDEATDFERVKAEEEQRARDKAESEARQGDMFGGGGIDQLIDRLNAAKIKPDKNQLFAVILPGFDPRTFTAVWNTSIDIAIGAVKAGRAIGQAVEAALDYLRSKAGEGFDEAQSRKWLETALVDNATITKPGLQSIKAHHGTPHKVDRFSMSKIGTGEGAQVYGWGLYFAENRQVAEEYQKGLARWEMDGRQLPPARSTSEIRMQYNVSEPEAQAIAWMTRLGHGESLESAIEALRYRAENLGGDTVATQAADWLERNRARFEKAGRLYTVELDIADDEFLDWDKPLSEQSEKVREALQIIDAEIARTRFGERFGNISGGGVYARLGEDERAASKKLLSLGIRGIRYLDGGSRSMPDAVSLRESIEKLERQLADYEARKKQVFIDILTPQLAELRQRLAEAEVAKPTYNYVIFDENDIRIVKENETERMKFGERIEAKLDSLKVDTKGKLYDVTAGLPILVWNTAIDVVIKAVKAGRTLTEAIDSGVQWVKANYKGKWDEAEFRQEIWNRTREPQSGRTAYGQKASAYPGGPLGAEPGVSVADDREYSALPIEFPELVRMARDLMGGQYPKLKERINLLGGRALGVFRGIGKGQIELRRDLFDLLTSSEKAALQAEANKYAEAAADNPEEVAGIARERYEYLLEQAYEKAKRENPLVASKVLAHEIGHLVDYLPQGMISGRGNLLGRIASLKNFLKHTLPTEPGGTGKPITPAERAALKREAEKQLKEELGPIQEIIETIMVEEPEYRIVGITVEDVKRLLGMDARESMPELYLWFAQQDSAVKKEILKAAMKGVIDERVAAMGKREQTGTKRTEKTVRKVSGRAPTVAEIRQRFQELLRAEMEKRRLLDLKELKAELEPLIAWWRGTEKMEDYFKPSEEMYAEAFSIFLNNPAAMEKRAPKYFRALLAYMERKPEVAKLWQEIQNSIKSGTIMKERVESLRNSWEADNEASLAQAGRRWAKSATDWLDNVLYHVDRRFGPVYRLAKKAGGAVEGRAREAIGSFLYRASEHELFLGRMNREVGVPLVAANLDWNDLGEFMFHQHIINNRFNLANPMGWTSKTSLERLEEMRQQMGEPAWQALNSAHGAFRKLYETQVVELLRSSGLTSPELQQAIDERVFYATFAAIKGKAESGIDQLLDDSFGNGTGAAIYKQVGNLGDIKQPATATVLKALSLISAAYRNQAKRATVEVMQQADPTMIRPADTTWDGKRRVPVERNTDKVGTIIVMEGGRPQAYYVPKVMADSLNQANPVQNLLEAAAIEANGAVKGLYTQHNYAFWPVNFVRDVFGWIMMMPKAGPIDYARVFVPAVKAARASLKARVKNVNAERALERKMLISRASYKGLDAAENEFEQKLQAFGLDPAMWDKQAREVSALVRAWNTYKELGQTFERVNKLAGMLYLDRTHASMPEWQKREIVRERAGSPDFLQKGASASRIDLLMMFFNPWKEGIRSLAKSAKQNPLSFTGKVATAVMLPSITQALATLGFLGDDLEEEYASIPDYDLSNYLVIPVGWANKEQKQVAYLRLPLWEPARLMHGLVTTAITGRGQTALNRVGGQIPGGNAWWKVASAWWAHEVQGRNPYDSFMGREVLDPSVFQAQGAQARWDLAKYSWNELGGSIIHRFRDQSLYDAPEGEVQEFLNAPVVNNLLGRWIKVSSRGIDDADRKRAEPVLQERAVTRLAVREMAEKILANPPQALTEDEKRVLADSYAMDYLMTILPVAAGSQASPLLRRLNKAGTREEKEMILSNP